MSKASPPPQISGKITAQPNPIQRGGELPRIIWETNDPRGGEVRVLTDAEEEKLVTRGTGGSVEIPWIATSTTYRFNLYGCSEPKRCLDQVSVRRTESSSADLLEELAAELLKGNVDPRSLAQLVATAAPRCLHSGRYPEFFRMWEEHGFHLTPVHFYQPIPDTRTLPESLWNSRSELAGIDMNEEVQLDLLRNHFPAFREEYEKFPAGPTGHPTEFYFDNGRFGGTDALVAYCMVRHFKPRLIVEIGSGYSSLISGKAAAKNGNKALVCVEPYPLDFFAQGFPGLSRLIEKKVEDLDLSFFSELQSGDILFIDSSHTVKIGGDVNYLFLEVLPRLNPGVLVHVHDILFPFEYRRDWVMDELRFWGEQYLLQSFLAFNSEFEVLFCNNYLADRHLGEFKATFPNSPWWGGGSFWMRRKEAEK